MPARKKAAFDVGSLPAHLRKLALDYLLLSRKTLWKRAAAARLEFHKENSFVVRQTHFRRGTENLRQPIEEAAQRAIHVGIYDRKIQLVNEEVAALQAQADALRQQLLERVANHIRSEREQAYIIMGLNPAEVPEEQRARNNQAIQEELFNNMTMLGKQLVKVRAEAEAEQTKWVAHQNERAAQRQARLQLGDQRAPQQAHPGAPPQLHLGQAPVQARNARDTTIRDLVRREIRQQLNNSGRNRRARSAQPRRARSRSNSTRHTGRNRSRSRSHSTSRSRTSSRVSFRMPRQDRHARPRSRTPSRGRHGAGRTGSGSSGRGNRGRGRGRGRGLRGRRAARGRF